MALDFTVGKKINIASIKDQFDKPIIIDDKTTHIILSSTEDSGKAFVEFINKNPKYLVNKRYIANISKAPSLVYKLFMRPKFKQYDFSMGIVLDENVAKKLPTKEEFFTVITLQNTVITDISYRKNVQTIQ